MVYLPVRYTIYCRGSQLRDLANVACITSACLYKYVYAYAGSSASIFTLNEDVNEEIDHRGELDAGGEVEDMEAVSATV